jgi:hypothetical protein
MCALIQPGRSGYPNCSGQVIRVVQNSGNRKCYPIYAPKNRYPQFRVRVCPIYRSRRTAAAGDGLRAKLRRSGLAWTRGVGVNEGGAQWPDRLAKRRQGSRGGGRRTGGGTRGACCGGAACLLVVRRLRLQLPAGRFRASPHAPSAFSSGGG